MAKQMIIILENLTDLNFHQKLRINQEEIAFMFLKFLVIGHQAKYKKLI